MPNNDDCICLFLIYFSVETLVLWSWTCKRKPTKELWLKRYRNYCNYWSDKNTCFSQFSIIIFKTSIVYQLCKQWWKSNVGEVIARLIASHWQLTSWISLNNIAQTCYISWELIDLNCTIIPRHAIVNMASNVCCRTLY